MARSHDGSLKSQGVVPLLKKVKLNRQCKKRLDRKKTQRITLGYLKPRETIATCRATCCVRLATVSVAMCCNMLSVVGSSVASYADALCRRLAQV